MPSGRISDYTPELVEKAWKYVNGGWRKKDKVPTVAGLACEINIDRSTAYAWAKDEDKSFSDILGKIMQLQERELINSGLDGNFNAPITKMMLTKHGYSDKIEQETTHSVGNAMASLMAEIATGGKRVIDDE